MNDDLKQWLVRGWPAAGLTLASALGAAPATLSGWRGNGTGCFPDAHPPTQWERISPVMKGLRCQARKPSRPEVSGTPAYCGAVAEWLVLGPLPAEGEKPVEQEILPDEANLTPDEGEKVQGVPWTRRTPENGIVDFAQMFGAEAKGQPQFAEIAPVVAKLDAINAAFSTAAGPTKAMLTEKADLQKKLTSFMGRTAPKRFTPPSETHRFAVGAPSTDGTNVYVWYAFGVTACYDLDGNRQWISADNHIVKHHGHNSTPILVGTKFIVHMKELMAFDTPTGKVSWRVDIGPSDQLYEDHFHDSFNGFRMGGEEFLYVWGQILRVADGRPMWAAAAWREGSSIPTPVIADGVLYHMTGGGFVHKSKLPTALDKMAWVDEGKKCGQGFEVYKHIGFAASPLVAADRLYLRGSENL